MKKIAKKAILTIMLLSLLVTQNGCIELWGRYPVASPTSSYLAAYGVSLYAQAFTTAMLIATNPLLIPPGSSAPMTLLFQPQGPTLLTYSILAAFSTAYTFHGFGLTGITVGQYRILDPNGNLVRLASIYALSNLLAYIDLNQNNQYDADYEPTMAWKSVSPVLQALLITFPLWAGGPVNQAYYNLTDFAALTLFAGIISYPLVSGSYPIAWTFTAIDPVTGGEGNTIRQLSTPVTLGLLPPDKIALLTVILGLQLLTHKLNTPVDFSEATLNSNGQFGFAEILYIMGRMAKQEPAP